MKSKINSLFLLLFLFTASLGFAQGTAVYVKSPTDRRITGNLTFENQTLSVASGAAFNYATGASFTGDTNEFLSDIGAPSASATTASLNLKANLAGGASFTGTIVLPSTTSIGSISSTEIAYLDGTTSPVQTQIDTLTSAEAAAAAAIAAETSARIAADSALSTSIATETSRALAAEATAISTAATDATSKANAAIGYDVANVVSGWTTIVDDTFVRANTTPPATIGAPTTYASPSIGGNWTDASTLWRVNSNTITTTTQPAGGPTGPMRPAVENVLNQRVSITTGALPVSAFTSLKYWARLRNPYSGSYDSSLLGGINFNPSAQTAVISLAAARSSSPFQVVNSTSFAVVTGHSYTLTVSAESLYSGGFTVLRAEIVDAASPGVVLKTLVSTSVPTFVATCSQPGAVGINQDRSDIYHTDLNVLTRFTSARRLTNGLVGISSPLITSTTGNWVSVSNTTSAWTPGTPGSPVFRLANLAGCSITEQVVISPRLARLKITTGSTAGTLRIVEPSTGGTYDVSVASSSTEVPVVTNVVPVESTPYTVKLHAGLVTGGKAPYTFQWYRSTDWTFATSTTLTGATSIDLLDTPPDSKLYAYRVIATDSTGTPQTATSPATPAARGWVTAPDPIYTPVNSMSGVAEKWGYIGDSITTTSTTVVSKFEAYLAARGITITSSVNRASSGSYTGTSGNGWHPSSASGLLTNAISAFNTAGTTHVMWMLGTNDAAAFSVNAATYISNTSASLAALYAARPTMKVILNNPILETGGVTADANGLLITYSDALDQIVAANPNAVRGDRNVTEYFHGRFDIYTDEIHPNNTTGSDAIARYWADSALRYLDSVTTVTGRGTIANTGTSSLTSFTGSGTSSGTNTGDQTTVTGNAGTATVLQTARTINGVSFNGSANVTIPSKTPPVTVATLPASPTTGDWSAVTDALAPTYGAPVVGGGAISTVVWYDGTNWTCR